MIAFSPQITVSSKDLKYWLRAWTKEISEFPPIPFLFSFFPLLMLFF